MAPPAVPAPTATPSADAAMLTLTGGTAAVLLFLYGVACATDMAGFAPPGLLPALDPVRPASLPELWGAGWLAAAAVLALVVACKADDASLLRLGLLPAVLGLAETTDLAARLEPGSAALLGLGSGVPLAKLLADGLAGGLVLAAALVGRTRDPVTARAGRRCLLAVLAVGAGSVACDLAGSLCAGLTFPAVAARPFATIEESLELGLYAVVSALVLAATFRCTPRPYVP